MNDAEGAMAAVASLGDPLRRRLYRYVEAQDHAVGRDEAAEAVGVTRSAAAFHLDRLVDDGLLEAQFRRLTGRQGPGAGRPAKLYRRAESEIHLSLPARRYDLAAGLLAAAVTEAEDNGEAVGAALDRVARRRGAALAGSVACTGGRRGGPAAAAAALSREGYEPRATAREIVLANCPFSAVAADHPALMCRMNLALLEGFSAALPSLGMTARLHAAAGVCCVRLEVGSP